MVGSPLYQFFNSSNISYLLKGKDSFWLFFKMLFNFRMESSTNSFCCGVKRFLPWSLCFLLNCPRNTKRGFVILLRLCCGTNLLRSWQRSQSFPDDLQIQGMRQFCEEKICNEITHICIPKLSQRTGGFAVYSRSVAPVYFPGDYSPASLCRSWASGPPWSPQTPASPPPGTGNLSRSQCGPRCRGSGDLRSVMLI